MSDVRKNLYMHEYPFVCTQAGTRQLNKQEQRQAQAYMLGVVDKPMQPVWVIVTSGIAIIAGIVVGLAIGLSFLF